MVSLVSCVTIASFTLATVSDPETNSEISQTKKGRGNYINYLLPFFDYLPRDPIYSQSWQISWSQAAID